MTQSQPLRTVDEAAGLLGISVTSVWDLMRSGKLASVAIPSARGHGKRSMRRIEQSEIDAFIERHRQATAASS
jgi:excisionase family DNA binding protein